MITLTSRKEKAGFLKGEEQLANIKLAGSVAHVFTFRYDAFAYAAKTASSIRSRPSGEALRDPSHVVSVATTEMDSESTRYVPLAAVPFWVDAELSTYEAGEIKWLPNTRLSSHLEPGRSRLSRSSRSTCL